MEKEMTNKELIEKAEIAKQQEKQAQLNDFTEKYQLLVKETGYAIASRPVISADGKIGVELFPVKITE